MPREGGTIEELLTAINVSQESVADLAKLSETLSVMSDEGGVLEICRLFGALFERYDLPRNFAGPFNQADFDYFKFLGYEVFTDLIAVLLRDRRWGILQRTLSEPIPVKYLRRNDGPGSVYWDRLSAYAPMLLGYGETNSRLSYIADLVNERHTKGAFSGPF